MSATRIDSEPDFSLVLGGPLFQLLRQIKLSDAALGLALRRVVFAIAILWAPLVVLSFIGTGVAEPGHAVLFLKNIALQSRLLVVVPLLLIAEVIVHRRLRLIVGEFEARRLIRADEVDRFEAALAEARRWRSSVLAEIVLLAVVYTMGGFYTLRRYEALHSDSAYAWAVGGGGLSAAGFWLVFVSLPALQFLLLRWYYRLGIWARFLMRMAALDLDLNVTHPDKAGGLGFLGESLAAFMPLAAAHGVLLAGLIADRIFFRGAKVTGFEIEVFGGAVALVVLFAGPLVVFAPQLAEARRSGLRVFGGLAQTYVRDFRDKWMAGRPPPDEPLVGSGDIQSLADLGNSYGAAEQTRLAPIRTPALIYFLAAYLAPIAPLVLTMVSPQKLIERLVSMVF